MAAAEVVEADDGKVGAGDQTVEGLGEQVGVDRGALGTGEHEPVVVVLLAEGEALFELAFPPGAQESDRSWVEVDGSAEASLILRSDACGGWSGAMRLTDALSLS